jgi:hypothetical protein
MPFPTAWDALPDGVDPRFGCRAINGVRTGFRKRELYGNLVRMGNPNSAALLDGLFDPFSRCLDSESAQRVSEFRIDPDIQARIDTLAERANEGVLGEDERTEYEAFINAADFISILKLKAQRQLER